MDIYDLQTVKLKLAFEGKAKTKLIKNSTNNIGLPALIFAEKVDEIGKSVIQDSD